MERLSLPRVVHYTDDFHSDEDPGAFDDEGGLDSDSETGTE